MRPTLTCSFFFFNDTATTEIYTLSLHDALPICHARGTAPDASPRPAAAAARRARPRVTTMPRRSASRRAAPRCSSDPGRSEEHTSELQSLRHLVCRLLLEKKNNRASYATRIKTC